MQLKTQLRYTALFAAVLSMGAANAATIEINNPGFEDGFNYWEVKAPAVVSSHANTGSSAAKITGDIGKFEQDVQVKANTNYQLTAYVSGTGKIGVTVDGERFRRTGGGEYISESEYEYEKLTVYFNSGSETTITIWGNYYGDIARFDDFVLTTDEDLVDIANPGFEDSFSNWKIKNSAVISGYGRTGLKAAKITDVGGEFTQEVGVEANTDYELTAYISGTGKLGATVNGERIRKTGGGEYISETEHEYEKVTVNFNSGSETLITIWGNYYGAIARFDDFVLKRIKTEPVVAMTTNELTFSSVYDDGIGHVNFPAVNVIDDDTSWPSRWAAQTIDSDANLMLALEEDTNVTEVGIAWGAGELKSHSFQIWTLASTSDIWTRVYDGVSSGVTTDMEFYDITDISAQVIRIKVTANSAGTDWTDITEVKAFTEVEDENAVVEDPVVEEPVDEDPVDEQPTLEPGNAKYPSDLFNYEQWKITYPDGDEVKDLYKEENEYFYVNEDKNGIVFYAPVRDSNGTTKNSHYIRSELRERTEDGDSDIYWTTDGTHVAYVKQAITHLPIVKPHLVATQIHGNKDDGIDDAMVLRLEEEKLFLSFNGGKLHDDVTIKTDYKLGTVHEVIFEVINGKHRVYYSEDGGLNAAYQSGNAYKYLVKDGSKDYVMDLDYDKSYFKIGNYTQSNADKEGDYTDDKDNYGEVEVYDFWVDHKD